MSGARGKLVVISGPSGSGKTSIIEELRDHPRVRVSVSATTRPPRADELDGRDYHFMSRDDFLAAERSGEFVETNDVFSNGHLYGSLWSELREALASEDEIYVMELDIVGAKNALDAAVREGLCEEALSIFIAPPSMEVLETRLRNRGTDDEAAIAGRLRRAKVEMKQAEENDSRLVTNQSIDEAVDEVARLIGLKERRPWTTPK